MYVHVCGVRLCVVVYVMCVVSFCVCVLCVCMIVYVVCVCGCVCDTSRCMSVIPFG